MSIVAKCPHCETRFNLQAEMNGKSMRCPNLDCRQVFTVQALEATAPPPVYEIPPEPPPAPRPVAPTKPAASKPPRPKPAKGAEPEVVEGVVVDAAVVSPPKVKEVVWSEGTDVPPPRKGRKTVKPELAEEPEEEVFVRRKKKRNRRPLILAAMGVVSVAVVIFAVFYIIRVQGQNEEKLATAAKEHYDKGEFAEATKSYETLTKEYAGSKRIDEYKFFHDLSTMQTTVRSVTNREDYQAAVKRLREFIDTHKDSPFAKPKTGYGHDIVEAGKKLGEDIAAHAEDRVKAFQADVPRVKHDELNRAEKAIADGRELIPVIDPFRGPDDPQLTGLKDRFDQAEQKVKREHARTAAINGARDKLADPTDAGIQSVLAELEAAGFHTDPEAQALVAAAKGKLLDRVTWVDDPAAAQPPPPTAAASLLFVTPVGKPKPRVPGAAEAGSGVFLCVARGILYALKEENGELLWATRVGPDVTAPPAVARVELASGPTDVAVVASNVGNAPALAAHRLRPRTPEESHPLWYQPLPAPAAGPAVVVGSHAFVPLRDALGTVYEFDLTTGARVGYIRLGQPVAERGAALRPGTSLLYVAADARRLYVIDAGGKDDNGNRVNPRCVQVVATGHLPGTLRVPPLFVGPGGVEPADRWIVLAQAEGTAQTLLRAFTVGALPTPPAAGATVPETPAAPAAALSVPGWVTSAPVSDGERLAVVTDTGHFRIFGVRQPGNADAALFPIAAPPPATLPDRATVPGLVIPVEESAYWVVAGGKLRKARLSLVPGKGQEVVFTGEGVPLGEPVHAAQVGTVAACAVVRSLNSSGVSAVAFDLRDGEVRWQRQLGLVPAKLSPTGEFAAPIAQGDRFILVDEDGGIVSVPVASGVGAGQSLAAPEGWVVASAPPGATGPTVVAASAGGKVVYAVTPVNQDGPKFIIRRVADGKLAHEDFVIAQAPLTGQPAVVGESLLIPAGPFVYRLVPGDGRVRPGTLVAGPAWLGERRPPNPSCCITPLSDSSFVTSDGGKKLSRWDWPAGGKWNPAGVWELRDAVAGPGAVLPGDPASGPQLAVAEASGSVWLLAADKPGQGKPQWKPGGAIPAGKPSSGLASQPAGEARTTLAYVVDGKVAVALAADRDEPLWTARTGDDAGSVIVGNPQPAGANRWLLTDLAGRVVLINGETGGVIAAQTVGLSGAVPASASGVAADKALTPLSDGSAVVIELPKK